MGVSTCIICSNIPSLLVVLLFPSSKSSSAILDLIGDISRILKYICIPIMCEGQYDRESKIIRSQG
jgi:hypothetical protein